MPPEFQIRVQVNGTTFTGIYEVIDGVVALSSPDFGEHTAPFERGQAEAVAIELLRVVAEEAMLPGDLHFMRDDETS